MGWGVTLTMVEAGAAPVTPPLASTGNTVWAKKTFQAWPDWLLGSTFKFDPYQTASARPGPPALIQGNTFTREGGRLTWTGAVQCLHPPAALAALTNTCRWEGVSESTANATKRFRALSIERTLKSVSGEPARLSAMWISFEVSPLGPSRKVRSPAAFGVPMLSRRLLPLPAAWKTWPVTWSMAG